MSVCAGDIVRFLNDVGGGKVTRIKGKVAYVLIDQGFEIPVNFSELVVISAEKSANEVKVKPSETKPEKEINMSYNYVEREDNVFEEERKTENINPEIYFESFNSSVQEKDFYLALVAENQSRNGDEGVKLYLINNSDSYLQYTVGIYESDTHSLLDSGTLEPHVKVFISDISKDSYQGLRGFSCQAIIFKKGIYKPENVIDETLKIKSFKLLSNSTFKENEYFNCPAWLLPLDSSFNEPEKLPEIPGVISKVLEEKEKKAEDLSRKFSKRPEPVLIEVDLHIQELIDDYRGMSNTEMLNLQLSKFASELEKAISGKTHRIVFIHGVGNGTLKMALRKQLDELYSHLEYQDASYKEYGYGATMVILRR